MFTSRLTSRWALALPLACATTLLIGVTGPPSASATENPVFLGTTANFGVLAATEVTNSGTTTIEGDLGLSPGTSVTGFPDGEVAGGVYLTDGVALQAQADLADAYDDAAARVTTATIGTELGGAIVTPGVYESESGAFEINGTLTLDAEDDPFAVFIFKTETTLVTSSESIVELDGDARSSGVFWAVGSSATLGTDSVFQGNVLAADSIEVAEGAVVTGRALARDGAVTLDTNTLTRPADLPYSIINTTTELETSVNPALPDEEITFTATVTPEFGAAAPTGVVAFIDKTTIIGTGVLDIDGVATFAISTLTIDRHSIFAVYLGTDGFLESVSATTSVLVTETP